MARTGRFGRLPTAAPDLSSQIVSMMEQYENARDRNIHDAWTKGGKFEGKKVTDQRILAHYRKRRNDYDRDDPEWDMWDNRLWQMRFDISDQTVGMQYANGKISASAVANHYRSWAGRVPKNSAVYRDLMSRAGQFAKTASAASTASSKQGDWDRFQNRWNALEKDYIKPAESVYAALNNYAQSQGLLDSGQDLYSLTTYETAVLDDLLAGIEDTEAWPSLRKYLNQNVPGWDPEDGLDMAMLTEMSRNAKQGIHRQIALAQGYPGDLSSWITNRQTLLTTYTSRQRLKRHHDTVEDYVEARDDWLSGRMSARTPFGFMAGDGDYIKALEATEKRMNKLGLYAEAGAVHMEIEALKGNVEVTRGSNVQFLWQEGSPAGGGTATPEPMGSVEAFAREQSAWMQGLNGVVAGTHFVTSIAPTEGQDPSGIAPPDAAFAMHKIPTDSNGQPKFQDEGVFLVGRKQAGGSFVTPTGEVVSLGNVPYLEIVTGKPVYASLVAGGDPQLVGYLGEYDNHPISKVRDPASGAWKTSTTNAWARDGVVFTPHNAGGVDGLLLENDSTATNDFLGIQKTALGNTPANRVSDLYNLEPGEDASEEQKELHRQRSEAPTEEINFIGRMSPNELEFMLKDGIVEPTTPSDDWHFNYRFRSGTSREDVAEALNAWSGSDDADPANLPRFASEFRTDLGGISTTPASAPIEGGEQQGVGRLPTGIYGPPAPGQQTQMWWEDSFATPVEQALAGASLDVGGALFWETSLAATINHDATTRAQFGPETAGFLVKSMMYEPTIDPLNYASAVGEIDQAWLIEDRRTEAGMLQRLKDQGWQTSPATVLGYAEDRAKQRGPAWDRFVRENPELAAYADPGYDPDAVPGATLGPTATPYAKANQALDIFRHIDPATGSVDTPFTPQDTAPPVAPAAEKPQPYLTVPNLEQPRTAATPKPPALGPPAPAPQTFQPLAAPPKVNLKLPPGVKGGPLGPPAPVPLPYKATPTAQPQKSGTGSFLGNLWGGRLK